jgi:hypothetical protein
MGMKDGQPSLPAVVVKCTVYEQTHGNSFYEFTKSDQILSLHELLIRE